MPEATMLHVFASERLHLAGAAMGGFFSYRTVSFGVGSVFWSGVHAVGSCAALERASEHAQTNCFVCGPIPHLKDLGAKTHFSHGSVALGVIVGIDICLRDRSGANNVEVRMLAKKKEFGNPRF